MPANSTWDLIQRLKR